MPNRPLIRFGALGAAVLTAAIALAPAAPANAFSLGGAVEDFASMFEDQSTITIDAGTNDAEYSSQKGFIYDPNSMRFPPDFQSSAKVTVSPDRKTATVEGQGVFTIAANSMVTFTKAPGFVGAVDAPVYESRSGDAQIFVTVRSRAEQPTITSISPQYLTNSGNLDVLNAVCLEVQGTKLADAGFTLGGIPMARVEASKQSVECPPPFNRRESAAPDSIIVKPRAATEGALQGLSQASLVATLANGTPSEPFAVPLRAVPQLRKLAASDVAPEGQLYRLGGQNLAAAATARITINGRTVSSAEIVSAGEDFVVLNMPPQARGTNVGVSILGANGQSETVSLTYTQTVITLESLSSRQGPTAGGQELTISGICLGVPSLRVFFGEAEATVLRRGTTSSGAQPAVVVTVPPGTGTVDIYAIGSDRSCTDSRNLPRPAGYALSNTLPFRYLAGPSLAADTADTVAERPTTVDVLGNDVAETGLTLDAASVVFSTAGQPADAVVAADRKGLRVPGQGSYRIAPTTGAIDFTPEAGFIGSTSPVSYTVADSAAQTASATITVRVGIPSAATDDLVETGIGEKVTVDVLGNDVLATGASWDLSSLGFPTEEQPADAEVSDDGTRLTVDGEGTYSVEASGTITFAPQAGFSGTASPVLYQVADSFGTVTGATLTVTVAAAPVLPAADAARPSEALAFTGADAVPLVTGALVLLLAGAVAFVVARGRGRRQGRRRAG